MRVISVRDVNYEIVADAVYHSAFLSAAIRRITSKSNFDESLAKTIEYSMLQDSAKRVYAIVIENEGTPVFTLCNVSHSLTSVGFRRILRIQL